ncbi:hypothetical protein LINPERPRIM_LOCUS8404 [Linum perenne]
MNLTLIWMQLWRVLKIRSSMSLTGGNRNVQNTRFCPKWLVKSWLFQSHR